MDSIYCRTTKKGILSFYVKVRNIEYFLFLQEFRVSVKEHFKKGLSISEYSNYSSSKIFSVRKTLDKLKIYIPHIEKKYGIAIYNKTKKHRNIYQKRIIAELI